MQAGQICLQSPIKILMLLGVNDKKSIIKEGYYKILI
jgi:hypothetical protein